MDLTAENVSNVFKSCLFNEGEDSTSHVVGEAVKMKVGFHPQRLEDHRIDIELMLNQLPDQFKVGTGDGYSFLEACFTAEGKHWGEHSNIDQLLSLGNAIGKAKFLMPRVMWQIFPGGMPYFVVG
jgi:hypothetical protein